MAEDLVQEAFLRLLGRFRDPGGTPTPSPGHYEDLSEAQTAETLGVAVGTVKSLVSRGMERLRGELSRSE